MESAKITVLHTLISKVVKCDKKELQTFIKNMCPPEWSDLEVLNKGEEYVTKVVLKTYPELSYLRDPNGEIYTGCQAVYKFKSSRVPPTPVQSRTASPTPESMTPSKAETVPEPVTPLKVETVPEPVTSTSVPESYANLIDDDSE